MRGTRQEVRSDMGYENTRYKKKYVRRRDCWQWWWQTFEVNAPFVRFRTGRLYVVTSCADGRKCVRYAELKADVLDSCSSRVLETFFFAYLKTK